MCRWLKSASFKFHWSFHVCLDWWLYSKPLFSYWFSLKKKKKPIVSLCFVFNYSYYFVKNNNSWSCLLSFLCTYIQLITINILFFFSSANSECHLSDMVDNISHSWQLQINPINSNVGRRSRKLPSKDFSSAGTIQLLSNLYQPPECTALFVSFIPTDSLITAI